MEEAMKTVVCPECGELVTVNPDEIELFSRIVCEGCYSTLEIIEEDPLEVAVVEIDPDEFDDDDYEEDEDE
jgi:Zn finger protein HypA/HybF involved in hydrogenase expression